MSSFNSNEKRLARLLSRYPFFKQGAKKAYQYLNYFLYKKDYKFRSAYDLHEIPTEEETFFGYYDKSPLSADQRYILFHQSAYPTRQRPPSGNDTAIQVCVWDLVEKRVIQTRDTTAFNWQQGARAQWLDSSRYIFNFFDGTFKAKIVNVNSGAEDVLPLPVYDVWKDEFAYTLNFRRLATLRPDYGYRNLGLMDASEIADLSSDGIYRVNLRTKANELIISLSDLAEFNTQPLMRKAEHKVNHLMIAPDGKHFMFLHRYIVAGRRFDRLVLADQGGRLLRVLADEEMVSHCCWMGNDRIIGYLRHASKGDHYYLIDIHTGKITGVGEGVINMFGDGHPSCQQGLMLFDTYPNKARMKELYTFDLKNGQLNKLGEFFEDLGYYGETRCDLHPRFSTNGEKIFFDSVHSHRRKLYWFNHT